MKKTKILTLASILLIIFALAACSKAVEAPSEGTILSPEPSSSPSSTQGESPDASVSAPPTAVDGSGSPSDSENANVPADYGETVFTLAELARYDGTNGMPAYIAVDGVVYDVSNVSAWRNGRHNGFTAGKDLTEEIKNISPHGTSTLSGLPVAGTLSE
ncbi:MAG: hypothetical protein JXB33_02040 [Clostridia bacterium]|nr:hypothetical protein [Clostridia bacterium]